MNPSVLGIPRIQDSMVIDKIANFIEATEDEELNNTSFDFNYAESDGVQLLMLKVHNTIIGNEISECRRAAVDVLTSLAQVCYHVYKPYMAIIFEDCANALKNDQEDVQAAVLDFFTELCTSELDRLEDRLHVEHYTAQSTQTLVPILLEVLTMSKGNGDEMDELQDVWKISFQSLTLLGLISQLVSLDEQAKYNFASQIMPFVSEYSLSDTWQLRKAALLAYGAIVTTGVIETDALQSSVRGVLEGLQFPVFSVRDSAAWVLSKMAAINSSAVAQALSSLDAIGVVINSLKDAHPTLAQLSPSIASSSVFETIVAGLYGCFDRTDVDEERIMPLKRAVADTFTALFSAVTELLPQRVIDPLLSLFHSQLTAQPMNVEMLSLACSMSAASVRHINPEEAVNFAPNMVLALMSSIVPRSDSALAEAALLCVGSAIFALKHHSTQVGMDTLSYILGQNAINPACVDLLIDICRSGGVDVASNAPQIINNIFARLKTKNLMYKTKSKLYAALGAIAEIIGPAYDHYLKTTIDALIAGVNSAEELVTQDEMNDLEEDSEECEYLEMLLVILPQTFMQLLNAVPIQSPPGVWEICWRQIVIQVKTTLRYSLRTTKHVHTAFMMLGLFMDKVGWNIFEAKDSMAQLIPMVEQESQNTPDLHDVGQRLVNVLGQSTRGTGFN